MSGSLGPGRTRTAVGGFMEPVILVRGEMVVMLGAGVWAYIGWQLNRACNSGGVKYRGFVRGEGVGVQQSAA